MAVNNNLKKVREEKKITQAKLSELSGISRATICKIESDEGCDISTNTIAKLCLALGEEPKNIFFI